MRIDSWTHIFPPAYFERLRNLASASGPLKRWMTLPSLYDLDKRFEYIDRFPDYVQVLTPSAPPVEQIADGQEAIDLAKLMNDGLAELVERYPDRFIAFAGSLPMNDPDAACAEVGRAAAMGARGFQLFTNVRGLPLDDPRFAGVFAAIAERDLAIWMHPVRGPIPDYPTEKQSHFELWWCFGWPYDSSIAMSRLVFSGLFDRHPNLRITTHHMGAMIPYFAGRIAQGLGLEMGARTPPSDAHLLPGPLEHGVIEYFRMFYADTSLSGSAAATRCGLDFFGDRHAMFGTDFPFDNEGGSYLIRETLRAIDELDLDPGVRRALESENVLRFMRMNP